MRLFQNSTNRAIMPLIRPATLSDRENIVNLHVRSWRENYSNSLSEEFLHGDIDGNRRHVWHSRLSEPNEKQYVVVAEVEGQFAGFACTRLDNHDELGTLVDNLHVEPDYRRCGIATFLLNETAKWVAENRPDQSIYLDVYEENERAQKYYANIGGHFTTEEPFSVKAADGGYASTYRVVWDTPQALLDITQEKINQK